ncbi:SusC/RagA family TonB-linked outer membrane protein [Rufibacter soli]
MKIHLLVKNPKIFKSSLWRYFLLLLVFLAGKNSFAAEALHEYAIPSSFQQDTTKSGLIVGLLLDTNEKPIVGAEVLVQEKSEQVFTDQIGVFRINAEKGDVLTFKLGGNIISQYTLKSDTTPRVIVSSKVPGLKERLPVRLLNKVEADPRLTATSTDVVYTDDLVKSNVTSVRNALTGRLAGLYTVQSSGMPGADAVSTSLRGQEPLVIIDGIPRNLTIFDLEEIESVTVLKDALSTAMLGVRSSNGALLITTRKGFEGKQRISFTAQTAIQKPLKMAQTLNSFDYASLYNEARQNDGLAPTYTPEQLEGYRSGSNPFLYPNVNWQKEVMRKSSRFDRYTLNVAGGGKTAKYFVALEHFNQTGIFKSAPDSNDYETNNYLKSYVIRSNVDINITDRLSAGIYLLGRIMDGNEPAGGGISLRTNGIFNSILNTPSLAYPVYNPNGTLAGNQQFQNNILAQVLYNGNYQNYKRDILTDFYLKRELDDVVKGLWIRGTASFSSTLSETHDRWQPFVVYEGFGLGTPQERYQRYGNPGSQVNNTFIDYQGRQNYFELALGYDRQFEDHGINATLLGNRDNSVNGLGSGNSNNVTGAQRITLPLVFTGVSGRLAYDYKKKYVAEVAFGYNGSNRYPGGTKRGFFPAAGLAYNISEEDFLKNVGWLSFLKLSGSVGQTGWDEPGYFNYKQYYFDGAAYPFGTTPSNQTTLAEQQLANPNITWEKAIKYNFGIQSRFLNDQLGINVEYFRNSYSDLLMQRGRNSALIGNSYPNENIGKNRYNGVELQVSWQQTLGKGFNYYISGNASSLQSEVIYQDEVYRQYDWMNRTGQPVGQRFGFIADGFFQSDAEAKNSATITGYAPKAGDIKYRDLNSDGVIDQFDQTAIGNTKPLFYYGVDLGFSFKGFDFSALIQGVQNRDIYLSGSDEWEFQNGGFGQAYQHHLGRWTPATAATATYPRLSIGSNVNNQATSSFWVHSGEYVRLKNLEVGYTLPTSVAGKVKLQSIRVFANGLNLLTKTDLDRRDPEVAPGTYPIQRVMNMGINIKL